jgi:hypothetical protein
MPIFVISPSDHSLGELMGLANAKQTSSVVNSRFHKGMIHTFNVHSAQHDSDDFANIK